MKKTITLSLVSGVLLTLVVLLGWNFITLNRTVNQDHSVLAQIVSLINQSQQHVQASQPAAAAK